MNLHEDIIEKIFIHLDDSEKLQVLLSVDWLRSMKSLTKTFCLDIHTNNYQDILKSASIYNDIWVRRIDIQMRGWGVLLEPMQPMDFVPWFRDSLEQVTLSYWCLPSKLELFRVVETLEKLNELRLICCRIEPSDTHVNGNLKQLHLKILKLDGCSDEVMSMFIGQEVEHLEFRPKYTSLSDKTSDIIDKLVQSACSVRFNGGYKDSDTQYTKLRKLKISNDPSRLLSLGLFFIKANCDNLRELEIDSLPFNLNGGSEMNFILTKMNLNKFTCNKSILIDDGKLQPIKKIEVYIKELSALYEVMRHFQSIKKVVICSGVPEPLPDFAVQHTDLFLCVDELVMTTTYVHHINTLTLIGHFRMLKSLTIIGDAGGRSDDFLNALKNDWL